MVETFFVVTGVIQYKGKILILRKALDDYNFPGKWGFCSGFVKEFETAENALLREIKEETKLKTRIIKSAKPIEINNRNKRFIVACFLCKTDSNKVRLDHENIDFKWITLSQIKNFDCVPGAKKDINALNL